MKKLLFEQRFEGMRLRVNEEDGVRTLTSDESIIHTRLPMCAYQRRMLEEATSPPHSILHLGLGGGAMVRSLLKQFPNTKQTVIEKCPFMPDIAHHYFDLPTSKLLSIEIEDALSWCYRESERMFDLIFIDACDSEGPIEGFYARDFITLLSKMLTPKGRLIGHTWGGGEFLKKQWKKLFKKVDLEKLPPYEEVVIGGAPFRYSAD